MATVWIPPLMQDLTHGQSRLTIPGETVRDVIAALDRDYPGMMMRLCENGRIRPGMAVVVDSLVSQSGLRHRLTDDSEVHFLPALNGG
jgi:sulfur-carrier protein